MSQVITGTPEPLAIVVRPNLFSHNGTEHHCAPEGFTLAELIAQLAGADALSPALRTHLRVFVSHGTAHAREVPPDEWPHYVPVAGSLVSIHITPAGGGGKNNRFLQAILVIAIAVAAYYSGGAASSAYSSAYGAAADASTASLIQAGVAAAVNVAGNLALAAIFKPSIPSTPSGDNDAASYWLRNQSNRAAPYEVIPRVYGRMLMAPRIVAIPRSIIRGGKQILQAVYSCGYGPLLIEDMKAGETPLTLIAGAQSVVHESFIAGDPLSLYTQDTDVAAVGVTLPVPAAHQGPPLPPTYAVTSVCQRATINLAFPTGVWSQNQTTGGVEGIYVWIVLTVKNPTTGAVIDLPGSSIQVDAAPGDKIIGISKTHYPAGSVPFGASWVIMPHAACQPQVMLAITLTFPALASYQIGLQQLNDGWPSPGWTPFYACAWVDVSSYTGATPINPLKPETIIELEVPASEQVSNVLQLFTVVATSKLAKLTSTGTLTAPAATRNPAAIYVDMLTGTAAARPFPLSRLNTAHLYAWQQACAAPAVNAAEENFMCDVVIEQPTTTWEAMHIALGCGRAAYTLHDSKHSVIVENFTQLPAQLFTEANSRSAAGARAYLDPPHGIIVQFIDPASNWEQREVVVYDTGFDATTATLFETLPLTGITRNTQAWRDGQYFFAEAKLRRETVTLETDIEYLACARGDLVYVAHDVIQVGGAPAYVIGVPNATTIDVGTELGTPTITGTGIRVRKSTGIGPIVNIASAAGNVITTQTAHGAAVGDLIVWGDVDHIVGEYLVQAISAQADKVASLQLIEYARALATIDSGDIPDYVPQTNGRPDTQDFGPLQNIVANISYYFDGVKPMAQVTLAWSPVNGAIRYDIARLGPQDTFDGVDSTQETSYTFAPIDVTTFPDDTLATTYRVTAINAFGARVDATTVATIGKTGTFAPPIPVGNLTATPRLTDIFVKWTKNAHAVDYIVRYPGRADSIVATNEWFLEPQLVGAHTVTVAARDALGQTSPDASASFTVAVPNAPPITGTSHSNISYLQWGSLAVGVGWVAETTHALDYYELSMQFIAAGAVFAPGDEATPQDFPLGIQLRPGTRLVGTRVPLS